MACAELLEFVEAVLYKQRICVHCLAIGELPDRDVDFGLRSLSGQSQLNYEAFFNTFGEIKKNTIYKLRDYYECKYMMLCLPGEHGKTLLIGPYMDEPIGPNRLTEKAAWLGIPPSKLALLEDCYGNIPVVGDDSFISSLIYSLGDRLWENGFEVVDLNEALEEHLTAVKPELSQPGADDMLLSMQLMEQRYNWENDLMRMVSLGQSGRAEAMIPDLANYSLKQRLSDQVRDMKNYCIICNTLMRKAAQQGGVHPMYLDRESTQYAIMIEAQRDIVGLNSLMREMIHNYCLLVRKHSMKDYSPAVRQAVLLIDSQLAGELSLRHIAAALKLNPSYLSSLFKKETGSTITEFICKRRIEQGANLLRNTSMQIQDIATYCGVPDANYFSKIFKKHKGVSPAEYRNIPQAQL